MFASDDSVNVSELIAIPQMSHSVTYVLNFAGLISVVVVLMLHPVVHEVANYVVCRRLVF
jgi:hypothetical protein